VEARVKFKIREGFKLFKSMDEAIDYECGGERSGVRPIAVGGQVVNFVRADLDALGRVGQLGKLEPVDDEARAYYGNTPPMIARTLTHPEEFARRAEEAPR
jgi:hypothetical protein